MADKATKAKLERLANDTAKVVRESDTYLAGPGLIPPIEETKWGRQYIDNLKGAAMTAARETRRTAFRVRLGVAFLKLGHRLLGMKLNSGSIIVRGKEYRW